MAIQGKADFDQRLAKGLKEIAGRRPVEKFTIKEITDKQGSSDQRFTIIIRINLSLLNGSSGQNC